MKITLHTTHDGREAPRGLHAYIKNGHVCAQDCFGHEHDLGPMGVVMTHFAYHNEELDSLRETLKPLEGKA